LLKLDINWNLSSSTAIHYNTIADIPGLEQMNVTSNSIIVIILLVFVIPE
jgi:hypothetical protein